MTWCDERTWSLQYGLPERSIFFSTHLLKPCTVGQLSIRWAKICNFNKIARKIEKQQFSQRENSTRNCHCVKSVDSPWGVNRCEQVWTGVNGCEQVWTFVNSCEQVWTVGTGVNWWEQVWKVSTRFEQVGTSQNRCEVLFFPDREWHTLQIRWATLCHFSKIGCKVEK